MGKDMQPRTNPSPLEGCETTKIIPISHNGVLVPPLKLSNLARITSHTRAKSEDITHSPKETNKGSLRAILCTPNNIVKSNPTSPTSVTELNSNTITNNIVENLDTIQPTYTYRDRRLAPVFKLTTTLFQVYYTITAKQNVNLLFFNIITKKVTIKIREYQL